MSHWWKKKKEKQFFEKINIKNGEEFNKKYLKIDAILVADISEKVIKASIKEFEIIPLYCVSLPRYT